MLIILFLVPSSIFSDIILSTPINSTTDNSSLATAIRTNGFLCEGPLMHKARTECVGAMWVTMQSRAALASIRMDLFESAVLQSRISTISSNSYKYTKGYWFACVSHELYTYRSSSICHMLEKMTGRLTCGKADLRSGALQQYNQFLIHRCHVCNVIRVLQQIS